MRKSETRKFYSNPAQLATREPKGERDLKTCTRAHAKQFCGKMVGCPRFLAHNKDFEQIPRQGNFLTFHTGYSIFPCNVHLNRLGAQSTLVLR